jgi:hypothetical protein
MKNIVLIFTVLLISFSACEKINLKTADTNVPVVECYVMPNQPIKVKISKQLVFAAGDTSVTFLKNLTVKISDGTQTETCTVLNDSTYISSKISGKENGSFTLEFQYNSKSITAETSVPLKPVNLAISDTSFTVPTFGSGGPSGTRPDPIYITWDNPEQNYYLVVVENMEDDPTEIGNGNMPKRVFRSTPTQSNEQRLEFMNFSYLGKHRIILFRLNAEYAALYETNGTSSVDIVPPPSNINNGLGIFTGINADTVYLDVAQ